ILQVREVSQGETLGYDATYTAPRDMRVATVGAGYADGLPVALSNKSQAIIHDQPVPIVGRISMDLTILDVTDVHLPVQVGSVVEFLGEQLAAQAKAAGTIDYELLVRLGQRLRRDYQRSDKDKPAARSKPDSPRRPDANRSGSGPRSRSGPRPRSGGKSRSQPRGRRPRS
ncbi:MAG: alanine racemase C-terminal domain-containing protein, partial [Pseudomonadota bacterium]